MVTMQESLIPLIDITTDPAEIGNYLVWLMVDEVDALPESTASDLDPNQLVSLHESLYGSEPTVPKKVMQELAALVLYYRAPNHISYCGFTQNPGEAMK